MNRKELIKSFEEYYGKGVGDINTYFSPGRVNIIGEHQDYNKGHVFPAALTIGIYGAVRLREDNIVRLYSDDTKLLVAIDLSKPIAYKEEYGWANYPLGMIASDLAKNKKVVGMDIYIKGNLPVGAGLSSSAALLVLMGYILRDLRNEVIDRVDLAKQGEAVEYNFVGVKVGIMDHFVIANGKKNCGVLLNCSNIEYELVPLEFGEYQILIMNTNKPRDLISSEFNTRIKECKLAEEEIRKHHQLVGLSWAKEADMLYLKDEKLRKRTRHAYTENLRVLEFKKALLNKDIAKIAEIINQSHVSLRDDFEVSCKELDTLVELALADQNCIAARMIGAGFGGCAIALVNKNYKNVFIQKIMKEYTQKIGFEPTIYTVNIGDGTGVLVK